MGSGWPDCAIGLTVKLIKKSLYDSLGAKVINSWLYMGYVSELEAKAPDMGRWYQSVSTKNGADINFSCQCDVSAINELAFFYFYPVGGSNPNGRYNSVHTRVTSIVFS